MNASHATIMSETVKDALSDYPEFLRKLLFHRGIEDTAHAETFLNPDYETGTHDPFLLSDMNKAVARLLRAIEENEKVTVYADFDADGIPGAVILHDFFKKIGFENFDVYIPHRHDEGYGVHREALEQLAKNGTQLMITVDVGITYAKEIDYAKELGIDAIVTDHHEPSGEIPKAIAVVNPKLEGENGTYPDPMLCGAAVAWKLVQAMCVRLDKAPPRSAGTPYPSVLRTAPLKGEQKSGVTLTEWSKWLLDMVGISTISDMVPLQNENRVLATYGLKVLQKSRRPGLVQLFKKIRVKQYTLNEDDIAFMLTPRINAASRMAHPMDAFHMLASTTEGQAKEAVDHLIALNDERKKLVATTVKQAKAKLKKNPPREVVVIGDPEWSAGILGLVATKLTEEFQRPSFVWSREGELYKGSCRGSNSVSVVALMEALPSDALVQFGGHAGAGGFTVTHKKIHFLEEALVQSYEQVSSQEEVAEKELMIEGTLALDEVAMQNYHMIKQCAPFGVGNPKPVFLFEKSEIESTRQFGKAQEHLEITFKKESGGIVKAIQFYMSPDDFAKEINAGEKVDLLATFDYSDFMGRGELRLRVVDII